MSMDGPARVKEGRKGHATEFFAVVDFASSDLCSFALLPIILSPPGEEGEKRVNFLICPLGDHLHSVIRMAPSWPHSARLASSAPSRPSAAVVLAFSRDPRPSFLTWKCFWTHQTKGASRYYVHHRRGKRGNGKADVVGEVA